MKSLWTLASRMVFCSLLPVASVPETAEAQSNQAVAYVFGVEGSVLRVADGQAPRLVRVGDRLLVGDRLEIDPGEWANLVFTPGGPQQVTESLVLGADSSAVTPRSFRRLETRLDVAARSARFDIDRSRGETPNSTPIGGATSMSLIYPDGVNVLGESLTLRWQAPPADSFVVWIEGPRSESAEFRVTGYEWTLPDSLSLQSGEIYRWGVRAPGTTLFEMVTSDFRLIDTDQRARIGEAQDELAEVGIDDEPSALFVLALIYDDLGLPAEKLEALLRLETTGTAVGPNYFLLRAGAYQAVGSLEAAAADRRHAEQLVNGGR